MMASNTRARLREAEVTGCWVWSAGAAGELKMKRSSGIALDFLQDSTVARPCETQAGNAESAHRVESHGQLDQDPTYFTLDGVIHAQLGSAFHCPEICNKAG